MIFEEESLIFRILDVLELEQGNVNMYNKARSFHALSYRIEADTLLSTKGGEYRLRDNDIAFVPCGLNYRRISKTDRVIVVHFELSGYPAEEIELFTPQHPEALRSLFYRLLACWQGRALGYRHEAAAILYEIFLECCRQKASPENETSRIQRSIDYINRHYTDPQLSIPTVAAQSYMSEVYFRKLFKQKYGTSPQKYIVALRIGHAASLIGTGYHTLKEIAYLSGYSDYKYFSVEFKRRMGLSPSEYASGEGG